MANRRMFSKTVVDSDNFLDLPLSSQSLYFHLAIRADDEGFLNNAKNIRRMIGASEDDFKLLVAKGFLILFGSGVCAIRHWDVHNYIRGDRKRVTQCWEERAQLIVNKNGEYVFADDCPELANGSQKTDDDGQLQESDCQVTDTCLTSDSPRIGKVNLSKDNAGEVEGKGGCGGKPKTAAAQPAPPPSGESEIENLASPKRKRIPYEEIRTAYNEICVSFPACTILSEARKKAIKARFAAGYTLEQFRDIFRRAEASSFLKGANDRNWTASFDWIIKDANMAKILSGNYDDHAQVARVSRGSGPGDRSSRSPTAWGDLPDGFLD